MPRPHAPFCDLPEGSDHGSLCISRPIARQAGAASEDGRSVEVTVDLAARRADVHDPRLVRLISEPQDITARFRVAHAIGVARSWTPRYWSRLGRQRVLLILSTGH